MILQPIFLVLLSPLVYFSHVLSFSMVFPISVPNFYTCFFFLPCFCPIAYWFSALLSIIRSLKAS